MVSLHDLDLAPSGYAEGATSQSIHRVRNTLLWRGMLFKKYRDDVVSNADDLDVSALEARLQWMRELHPIQREYLLSICAFPQEIVYEDGDVVGFLMREARSVFLFEGGTNRPRHISELGRRAELSKPDLPYFEPPHKLALLGQVLKQLVWLHEQGLVVGDLQPQNILVTESRSYRRVYFVDCDSFILNGVSVVRRREPDSWAVDASDGRYTRETDFAKFVLLTDRCLSEKWNTLGRSSLDFTEWMRNEDAHLLDRMWRQEPLDDPLEFEATISVFTKRLVRGETMYLWTGDASTRQLWIPNNEGFAPRSDILVEAEIQQPEVDFEFSQLGVGLASETCKVEPRASAEPPALYPLPKVAFITVLGLVLLAILIAVILAW